MLINIHSHLPSPKEGAVISATPEEIEAAAESCPGQLWSAGYHPWHLGATGLSAAQREALSRVAARHDVVAIGETGIDKTKLDAVPLFAQINAFKAHIDVASQAGKPLILHVVKGHDVVIPMLKDAGVKRAVVHGFRGKPSVAAMYTAAGYGLSFGEVFNPDTLKSVPAELIFAETDTSALSIGDIIDRMHVDRAEVTPRLIADNVARFLGMAAQEETASTEKHEELEEITISGAQKMVDDWIREIGKGYFPHLTNMVLLTEEVGELARVMARTYGEQRSKPGDLRHSIGEEMADVLWVLLCLANQSGIDLTSELKASIRKKTSRDRHRFE